MHNKAHWDDYLYFLRVARLGTLKAAGKSLNVNHSTVLRRINALEEKLEARLFERFKTGYVLTESGKDIFEQINHIEEEFLSIEKKILGRDVRHQGRIKISTTDTIGLYWLPTYIKKFNSLYPGIILDIDIKTGFTDLAKREADIVISATNHHPDYMIGKALAPIIVKLYASRGYIDEHGCPTDPEDLSVHKLLILNEELENLDFNNWIKKLVPTSAIAMRCNMLTSLYHYTKEGLGIAPLPSYVGDRDAALVPVMYMPSRFNRSIWILTHPDLKNTIRIKSFIRFFYEETNQK